jgi:hypothetical protein
MPPELTTWLRRGLIAEERPSPLGAFARHRRSFVASSIRLIETVSPQASSDRTWSRQSLVLGAA